MLFVKREGISTVCEMESSPWGNIVANTPLPFDLLSDTGKGEFLFVFAISR
jgi:hypothetical protein